MKFHGPWEPAPAPASAGEWMPRQLRLTFGGPSGDSDSESDSGGEFTSSDVSSALFGDSFQSTDSGSNFQSDGGGFNFSSDSTPSSDSGVGFSSSGEGGFQGGDTGGGGFQGDTGGQVTGGDQGGGGSTIGGTLADAASTLSSGMDLAGDAGFQGGNSPFGGAAGGPFGGGPDSTTGQGGGGPFGGFDTQSQGQATIHGPPSITSSDLTDLATAMTGGQPNNMAAQLGINDIGRNTNDAPVNIVPTVQPGELGTFGPPQAAPAYQGRSGMDMEFNPFGSYQAPTQENQGTQGFPGGRSEAPSLMDMFGPNTAQAQPTVGHPSLSPAYQYLADQMNNYYAQSQLADPAAILGFELGQQGRESPFSQISNQAAKGDFEGTFGGRPSFQSTFNANFNPNNLQPSLDYVPSRGNVDPTLNFYQAQQMAPPNQFTGQPSLAQENATPGKGDLFGTPQQTAQQAFQQTTFDPMTQQQQDTFDSRFAGDRPGWDPAQQTAGVTSRGPSVDFANAPQSLQQTLEAARSGDPNVMAPQFASMPWGTTFAQPNANLTPDMSNMLFSTQQTPGRNTFDPDLDPSVNPFAQPGYYGPPTTFQPAAPPAPPVAPPAVPTPQANPLSPFERGQVDERSTGPERGINPQDRDAPTRGTERTAAPGRDTVARSVEREASRTPLQVTVPGRVATSTQTQSRGGFAQPSRGQLDALLAQARTAPTLAGRIAALDQLNGMISAMRAAGLPNPYGRDPDPNVAAALRQGR